MKENIMCTIGNLQFKFQIKSHTNSESKARGSEHELALRKDKERK